MNLLGNLVWGIFGGLVAALGYFIGGFILCLTIIGIPWGRQHFKLVEISLMTLGRQVTDK